MQRIKYWRGLSYEQSEKGTQAFELLPTWLPTFFEDSTRRKISTSITIIIITHIIILTTIHFWAITCRVVGHFVKKLTIVSVGFHQVKYVQFTARSFPIAICLFRVDFFSTPARFSTSSGSFSSAALAAIRPRRPSAPNFVWRLFRQVMAVLKEFYRLLTECIGVYKLSTYLGSKLKLRKVEVVKLEIG